MKKFIPLSLLFVIFFNTTTFAQEKADELANKKKMEWFADAKLGIFIHWGIYSVKGVAESWSFFNNYLNHDSYMKQLQGFTAKNYNPEQWVKLIKESGAKYTVITSKHHDGIALWNSKQKNAITTLNNSAAKRDLLTPFVQEVKKAGLKTGIYFSLPDWSYPDYDGFTRLRKRYDFKQDPARFKIFQNYFQAQLNELSENYNPDLLWFDGDWEHTGDEWQAKTILENLRKKNKDIIINARLNGHGDYDTPEQGIPVLPPAAQFWELCYTMNDSWGYQSTDKNYKSPNMIIRTLVDCLGNGGNLLLDIGPKADGTIANEQINILKELGRWTKKHAEAIYATQRGLPTGHFYGKTTLKKDKKTLFLYLDEQQENLWLQGIKSAVRKIKVVGMPDVKINFTKDNNDNVLIHVPKNSFDKDVTVLALTFDDPIQLSTIEQPKIDFNSALRKTTTTSDFKIKQIANALQNGLNIFNDSNLSADGLDFKPNVTPIDNTMLQWVTKHAEALYKTGKGLPSGHFIGPTALSEDKQTIYLFVQGKPSGPIALKGIKNAIARIRVVGDGRMINYETYNKLYWSSVPGITYIDVPSYCLDQNMTIIAVLLNGPVELYREKVGAIESNL